MPKSTQSASQIRLVLLATLATAAGLAALGAVAGTSMKGDLAARGTEIGEVYEYRFSGYTAH